MSLVIASMRFQLLVCLTDLCGGLIYINNEKKKRKEKRKEKKSLLWGNGDFIVLVWGGGGWEAICPPCVISMYLKRRPLVSPTEILIESVALGISKSVFSPRVGRNSEVP